ncbi:glycosyltransferase [Magnetococcus sp. PR-3]|uniref:glycosyltransferase n=1 Tax=Magnetococcus sp. PR-3 TaxID=3120355 RepID=UPI002FCE1088
MGWLTHQTILLISPQPWQHVHISKHHYALELSKNNRVFFLQPPKPGMALAGPVVEQVELAGHDLSTVTSQLFFPRSLRFHMLVFYRLLMRVQMRRIIQAIGGVCDVVWCFDPNSYPDLAGFGARCTLYHPVDKLTQPIHRHIAQQADLILAPAHTYLDFIDGPELSSKKFFLNHGLSTPFIHAAQVPTDEASNDSPEKRVSCGYFGNLTRTEIDVQMMAQILGEHPQVAFHFWGPWDLKTPLGQLLDAADNVTLHGMVDKSQLAQAIQKMDCFVLSYNNDPLKFDRDNPHKVLEYLSTGKVVVSNHMAEYADKRSLLCMTEPGQDDQLPALFRQVIQNLAQHNHPAICRARMHYAQKNSYEHHLQQVTRWIELSMEA